MHRFLSLHEFENLMKTLPTFCLYKCLSMGRCAFFFSKNLCDMVKSAIALTLFAKNFQRSENSSIDKVFFFVPQVKSNLVTPRNGEPLVAPIQDFITGVKNKYKLWSIPTNTVSVLFFYDAGIQGRKNKVTLSAPSQLRQLYISLNKG